MRNAVILAVVVLIVGAGVMAYFLLKPPPNEFPPRPANAEPAKAKQPPATPAAADSLTRPPAIKSDGLPRISEAEAMDDSFGGDDDDSRAVNVYGAVTDAETGAPIAGALIYSDAYAAMLDRASNPAAIDDERLALSGMTEDEFRTLMLEGKPLPQHLQGKFGAANAVTDEAGAFSITIHAAYNESIYCRAKTYAVVSHATDQRAVGDVRIDFQLRKGATISGKVTNAANGDGVADVMVTVAAGEDAQAMPWQMEESISTGTATTAADGTYTVEGLPAGRNKVTVRDGVHGWLFDPARAANLTLAEGEQKAGIDLLVTEGLRAEGMITNEEGEPVENAIVMVSVASNDVFDFMAMFGESPSASSDEDGHYTAIGLRPGKNRFSVSHDDYASASAEIAMAEGEAPSHVDFTLVKGVAVSGIAKYDDGTPAAMTVLYLGEAKADGGPSGFDFRNHQNTEFTDEETGEFTFTHVAAGDYTLTDEPAFGVGPDDDAAASVAVHVDGKNPVTGLEITIPKDKSPWGRGDGAIEGIVLDREGNPAPDVGVSAVSKELAIFKGRGSAEPDETTDESGAFTLDHLSGSAFTVYAESDKGEASQTGVKPGDKVTLRLGPVTSISGVVVDANGDAVPGCKVELTEANAGEADTMAAMMESMMGSFMPGGGSGETTDDFGQFAFKHIEAGDYVVEAKSAGKGFGASDQVSVATGTEKSDVRVVLEEGATFAGIVVDGSGNPVQGANVSLLESTGGAMEDMMMNLPMGMGPPPAGVATSGADGAFVINGLKPGMFLLAAKHADFAPYSEKNVDVSNVVSAPHRITLGKGGSARGQYLVDGQPKGNVMIQLMGPGGMQMATTDSEGRFEVKGIPAGTYMVQAIDMQSIRDNAGDENPFSNMNYKSVTITEGGDVIIPFGGGVALSGTVPAEHLGKMTIVYLMRKGAPDMPSMFGGMDTMDPEAMMETGMQMMQYMAGMAEVKDDGTFNLTGIDPGEYELRVYASDFSMDDIDPSEFMNVPLEEMQQHAQAFAPKEVFKQPITVGDQPLAVEFPEPEAAPAP